MSLFFCRNILLKFYYIILKNLYMFNILVRKLVDIIKRYEKSCFIDKK